MSKRYQVFISSTYADLRDERKEVLEVLMRMKCIPAGMEFFPAQDISQFEFIKSVIDNSDYYILIIGGRYGSLTDTGISFTEAEYNYAKEKGIPIIAFLHNDPDNLPVAKSDTDAKLVEKLKNFREEASKGRLVQFWNDPRDLPAKVVLSMNEAIDSQPAIGWVRGGDVSNSELLSEINELRKEKEALQSQLISLQSEVKTDFTLAEIDGDLDITFVVNNIDFYIKEPYKTFLTTNWKTIFKLIFSQLYGTFLYKDSVEKILNKFINERAQLDGGLKASIDDESYAKIQFQFIAFGYIELGPNLTWSLTDKGKNVAISMLATKKAAK
ncbi:MAG: DUF4062 domain-containing protein [Pseudoalteromonas sp.]|uniref:DUF4062 domain-containing protein n=1 Tax=Pseudoalteromonas sp. TaxID=53249 RepID=UPI0025DC85CD|nr:DUF4062 domain-containing protein [Pseudoalteromonas sp.]MCH2086346.1 DUF4062 domain-containing protein [Pseudoalteromonas sp.]